MKFSLDQKTTGGAKVRLSTKNAATGKITRKTGWEKNLLMDAGLNLLANGAAGFPQIFPYCKVGSGTSPNFVNSGGSAIFTQAGNTLTASTAFFTSSMVGGIIKFGASGSAGLEQYISAFTSSTVVTMATSNTQATAIAGTFWQVNQTALQTYLYQSSTYPNGGSYNGYTISGNSITLFRTFNFAQQGTAYAVNEVGYGDSPTAGNVLGRIVLGSTVDVPNTDYLVVEIQFTWTVSPSAPTAVTNTGTGINTAGQIMWQSWACDVVTSTGSSAAIFTANGSAINIMDGSGNPALGLNLNTPIILQTSIQNASPVNESSVNFLPGVNFPQISNSGQPVGVGYSQASFSFVTTGYTVYAITFSVSAGAQNFVPFLLLLSTPYVTPNGTFSGTVAWQLKFSRTLTN